MQNTFDDALNTLEESHYINQYLPSQSRFLEQMSSLNQSLTTSIQQEFLSVQNWLHLMTTQSQLLMGLGLNGRLTVNNDGLIVDITDTHIGVSEVIDGLTFALNDCSCRQFSQFCQFITILHDVSEVQWYPWRIFVEMKAGCIPWLGLLSANTTWWHQADIVEHIRLIFGDHLRNQPNPIIVPLSNETETRFRYQNGTYPLFEDLIKEALLERWTGNLTRFDLLYQECAPIECTHLIQSQWSRLAASLLLTSICSGLNVVLRWSSFLFLRMGFYLIDRYRHQRDQGKLISNRIVR